MLGDFLESLHDILVSKDQVQGKPEREDLGSKGKALKMELMVEQLCNAHLTLGSIPTTVRWGESTPDPEFTSTFILDFWTGTMKKINFSFL